MNKEKHNHEFNDDFNIHAQYRNAFMNNAKLYFIDRVTINNKFNEILNENFYCNI